MPRLLPILTAIPLILACGLAEGLWTDRWRLSAELEQAPGKLAQVPRSLGPWEGQDQELDDQVVRQAELRAHLSCRYVHRQTGEVLHVLLVCGRAGPVTVHSPDVCFSGAGFVPAKPRVRQVVQAEDLSSPAEFWSERYHRAGAAIPDSVQLYYSWNAGGGWAAADRPRLAFARARALYKLYVVRQLPRADEPAEHDPIPEFLRQLLPEVERCLSAGE